MPVDKITRCVYVPPAFHVTATEERQRYDEHVNDGSQEGYRRFLEQTLLPTAAVLALRATLGRTYEDDAVARLVAHCEAVLGAPADGSAAGSVVAANANGCDAVSAAIADAARLWSQQQQGGGAPATTFCGLDFGCGPGPTLSAMMLDRLPWIRSVALYDKFYFPDESVWWDSVPRASPARRPRAEADATEDAAEAPAPRLYDFITATEVAEHLSDAGRELRRLWGHVRPQGGILAVQTSRTDGIIRRPLVSSAAVSSSACAPAATTPDAVAFAQWHYIRDPTHVTFFHAASFRYLGARWNEQPGMRVAAMFLCGPSVAVLVKA